MLNEEWRKEYTDIRPIVLKAINHKHGSNYAAAELGAKSNSATGTMTGAGQVKRMIYPGGS